MPLRSHFSAKRHPSAVSRSEGGCTPAALTEDRYYEIYAMLENMSDEEISRFRSAPENEVLLRHFDQYANRRALPILLVMLGFLAVSLAAGMLLIL